MATTATTPDGGPVRRRSGFTLGRFLLLLIIGIIVAAGLLFAFPPTGLIKDQVAAAATKALGRPVSVDDIKLKLWPDVAAEISGATIAGSNGQASDLVKVESIRTALKLKPLFSGKAEIDRLELIRPVITLKTAADGSGNWDTTPQTGAPQTDGTSAFATTLLNGATIVDGRITYQSPKFKEPLALEGINGTIDANGKITAKGRAVHHGESAAFDVAIDDAFAAKSGTATPVTASLDGKFLKANFTGTASATEAAGDVDVTTASAIDLARWMGSDVKSVPEQIPGSLKGKIKANATTVNFENADAAIGTSKGRINGTLAMNGPRPKFNGTIAMPRIDLDGSAPAPAAAPAAEEDLELETAPAWDGLMATLGQSGAAPSAAAKKPTATPAKPAASKSTPWSTTPIDLKALQYADVDAVIETDEIAFAGLDLKKARIKTVIVDGKLDAEIQQLAVGAGGSATGTLAVDSRKAKPAADLKLSMTEVAAEPVILALSGKPLLAGTSNVEITAKAEGLTQNDLAASVDGKARFRMSKGHIRGFDVRSIVSNWWNSLTGGLKFDINKKTGFEKLDAQYDIKRGVMTSSPGLDIGGSEVNVTSKGQVSLPAKEINQEIRVKVVPPPSAPPIPVKISGSWSKPSISMDWGDLLFSAAPIASAAPSGDDMPSVAAAGPDELAEPVTSFEELAPQPAQVPDDVKAAITEALSSNSAALSDDGKALLKSLLEAPAAASPPDAPAPETAAPPTETAPQ